MQIKWTKYYEQVNADDLKVGDSIYNGFVIKRIEQYSDIVVLYGHPMNEPYVRRNKSAIEREYWLARSNTDPHAD
jgi:hypothetical protein